MYLYNGECSCKKLMALELVKNTEFREMWMSFIQIDSTPLYPCLSLGTLSNTSPVSSLFFPFPFPGFSFLPCSFMCEKPPPLSYAGYDTLIVRIWKNLTQQVKVSDVLWCDMEYVTFSDLTDPPLMLAMNKTLYRRKRWCIVRLLHSGHTEWFYITKVLKLLKTFFFIFFFFLFFPQRNIDQNPRLLGDYGNTMCYVLRCASLYLYHRMAWSDRELKLCGCRPVYLQ